MGPWWTREEMIEYATKLRKILKEKREEMKKLQDEIERLNNELLETECLTVMIWNYDEEKYETE